MCYAQHTAITVCTGPNRQFAVTIIVFVNIKFVFVKSIVFIPTQCVGLIIDRDVADKRYIHKQDKNVNLVSLTTDSSMPYPLTTSIDLTYWLHALTTSTKATFSTLYFFNSLSQWCRISCISNIVTLKICSHLSACVLWFESMCILLPVLPAAMVRKLLYQPIRDAVAV